MTSRIETIARSRFPGFLPFFVNLSLNNGDTGTLIPGTPNLLIRVLRVLVSWEKKPEWFEFRSNGAAVSSRIYSEDKGGILELQGVSGLFSLEANAGEDFELFTEKESDYGVTGLYLLVP